MFDIKKIESTNIRDEYQVFLDGTLLTDAFAVQRQNSNFVIAIWSKEESQQAISHRLSELRDDIEKLELRLESDWSDLVDEITITRNGTDKFELSFKFDFTYENWAAFYSFAEYANEFYEVIKLKYSPEITWEQEDEESLANGFTVSFYNVERGSIIETEIARHSSTLRAIDEEVEKSLESKLRSDSVVMYFNFPEEVKVPCEQYLLYFVQFLQDLGIEATSELEHQVGQVLFTVTPTNAEEALDKIRIALDAYLHMPSCQTVNLSGADADIAIQRLAANIYHLRGQLALAQAMLQSKDATIQSQQLTITNQQRLLSDEIMIDSLREVTPAPDKDKEEMLGGTLAITKYEGKGFEINLPEIFRQLKRLFKEDEQ